MQQVPGLGVLGVHGEDAAVPLGAAARVEREGRVEVEEVLVLRCDGEPLPHEGACPVVVPEARPEPGRLREPVRGLGGELERRGDALAREPPVGAAHAPREEGVGELEVVPRVVGVELERAACGVARARDVTGVLARDRQQVERAVGRGLGGDHLLQEGQRVGGPLEVQPHPRGGEEEPRVVGDGRERLVDLVERALGPPHLDEHLDARADGARVDGRGSPWAASPSQSMRRARRYAASSS
nr:hypothetical protein [Cellulosimicrobium sp. MM]